MTDETRLDLAIERTPPALVWRAWTHKEHLETWFAPRPVRTSVDALGVRPGGAFDTTMTLPDGTAMTNRGCFLEIVPERRIAFTDAMTAGWRPAPTPFMTAVIDMAPAGGGTLYRARVLHHSEADRTKHEEMGFEGGWGTAIAQLDETARGLAR